MSADLDSLHRRAVRGLSRPGAWLAPAGDGYALREGTDRRRRALLAVPEAVFQALVRDPGLAVRPEGGWRLARGSATARPVPPPPGRPGVVEGERLVATLDGRVEPRRANLGASATAWLASRRDPHGRPWLSRRQLAAAERLSLDYERCGVIGRLTMAWDAAPRDGAPRGRSPEPAERARAAKDRLHTALAALDPPERAVVERVVLAGEALQAVERHLGLRRRTARLALQAALDRLADHYRLP